MSSQSVALALMRAQILCGGPKSYESKKTALFRVEMMRKPADSAYFSMSGEAGSSLRVFSIFFLEEKERISWNKFD